MACIFFMLLYWQGKPKGQGNVTFAREELLDEDPMVC